MKRSLFRGIIFAITLCITALFSASSVVAETYELKLASPFPPMQVITRTIIKPWAEEIEKVSNGKIRIKLFVGGSLGKAPAHYELAEKGIVDIAYHLHDYTPGRFPMTSVFSLPFMTPSAKITSEAMWKTFEQEPDFRKEYANVKVLALFCHPGGDFHMATKPIRSVADFKGLKIRSANSFVNDALQLWGAIPVSMPITETYQSMERGVVDGTVLPWEGLATFKLEEVTKYSTITDFYTMTMILVMNKKKWDSLPKDVQGMIDSTTGLKMSSKAGEEFDATDVPFRKRVMDKGIQEIILPDSEKQKLIDLTMPMRQKWIEEMKEKGLNGEQVLKTALNLLGIK
jgi:TRAP-type C4-dicarboxylate transport system substrate-binding protein